MEASEVVDVSVAIADGQVFQACKIFDDFAEDESIDFCIIIITMSWIKSNRYL